MEEVILVIHLIVAIALVATVLLQRSEGGALGIGGGGSSMFASRGAANLLTRATAILAGVFFLTSISLTLIHSRGGGGSVFDEMMGRQAPAATSSDQPASGSSVLPQLPGGPVVPVTPSVPQPGASATPQSPAPTTNATPAVPAPAATPPAAGSAPTQPAQQ